MYVKASHHEPMTERKIFIKEFWLVRKNLWQTGSHGESNPTSLIDCTNGTWRSSYVTFSPSGISIMERTVSRYLLLHKNGKMLAPSLKQNGISQIVWELWMENMVIQAPKNSGSYYFNYKGQHSTVLMAIVDAEYKFLIATAGSNRRVSDGGVFKAGGVAHFIEIASNQIEKTPLAGRRLCIPYVFVADDAFPLKPHIMKPYLFNSQGSMRIYNYRLSRARRIVENA